jgi:hypothetical protein
MCGGRIYNAKYEQKNYFVHQQFLKTGFSLGYNKVHRFAVKKRDK